MADLAPTQASDINLDTTNEPVFVRSQPIEVLKVLLLGAGVGILTALLSWLLQSFVFDPIFCGSSNSGVVCGGEGLMAYYVSAIVTGLLATILLANWQIFRPLLIVVATIVTLWGFKKYTAAMADESPVEYYLYSALLFGLCYLLFYWLLRLHNFVVSLIFVIVAAIGIRLFVVS